RIEIWNPLWPRAIPEHVQSNSKPLMQKKEYEQYFNLLRALSLPTVARLPLRQPKVKCFCPMQLQRKLFWVRQISLIDLIGPAFAHQANVRVAPPSVGMY